MAKTSRQSDQFMLRLPDGLKERIRLYADQHGRSINAEIVRILEREFPKPWPFDARAASLVSHLELLKTGDPAGREEHLLAITNSLEKTIEGIVSGRITHIDESVRNRIAERYHDMKLEEAQADEYFDYDEDELKQRERDGTTAKFVEPDFPDVEENDKD